MLIMHLGPRQRAEQVLASLEYAAEAQLLVEKTNATAVRTMLGWLNEKARARLTELTRQPGGDEARMDEAARHAREIKGRLDGALHAEQRARMRDLQLQTFKQARAAGLSRLEGSTGEAELKAYQAQVEIFADKLEGVVDGAGRTVERVEFQDVPQETVTRLGGALPVKAGEVYSSGALHRTAQAVQDFDPRLRFYFVRDEDRLVLRIQPLK